MPADLRRRDDITAAIDAYDSAHPSAPLPRDAARLLAVMFAADDVCQQSLEQLAAEGFKRDNITLTVRALIEAGLASRQASTSRAPYIYRLLLTLGDGA